MTTSSNNNSDSLKNLTDKIVKGQTWEEAGHIWKNGDLTKPEKYHQTVRELIRGYVFKTPYDTDRLYLYNQEQGIYNRYGEKVLNRLLEIHLSKFLKTHDKNEIISKVKQRTYFKRPPRPENPWLVPLENGVFDMENEELLDFSPRYFFTSKLPFPYNPKAEPSKFLTFLPEVVNVDFIPVVQEMFGYCLYRGYPFRKLFLFLGQEGIGKSVLLKVLYQFLGGNENVAGEKIQKLTENRFGQYQLYHKLANIYADVPTKPIYETSYLKMLTGGDPISAERKNIQERVEFFNYAKLIFSGNDPPKLDTVEEAVTERFKPIKCRKNWENKIPRKKLLAKLTTKEESSGIFNWAVQGLKRVMQQRGFYTCESAKQFKKEWLIRSNPLYVFCKEKVEREMEKFMPKKYFYQNFALWCEKHNVSPPSKQYIGMNLGNHLPGVRGAKRTPPGQSRQVRCWIGIDWTEESITGEKEVYTRRELKGFKENE